MKIYQLQSKTTPYTMQRTSQNSNEMLLLQRELHMFMQGSSKACVQEIIQHQARWTVLLSLNTTQNVKAELTRIYLHFFELCNHEIFYCQQQREELLAGHDREVRQICRREYLLADQKCLEILEELWSILKGRSEDEGNPNFVCVQMQLSSIMLSIFLPVIFGLYRKVDLSIKGQRGMVDVAVYGKISPTFKEDFEGFANLIIFKSNIDWIVHENTAQRHHSRLYEKLDVMRSTKFLNKLPQRRQEVWQINRGFLNQARRQIVEAPFEFSEIGQIPNYLRRNQQEFTVRQPRQLQILGAQNMFQPQNQGQQDSERQTWPNSNSLPKLIYQLDPNKNGGNFLVQQE